MKDIFNGEIISRGHSYGITDDYITELCFSTPIDLPLEKYPVVCFPNPKQGWFDRFWNGQAYIFMTPDFVVKYLSKGAR